MALWAQSLDEAVAFLADHFGTTPSPEHESHDRPGCRSRSVTLADRDRVDMMIGPSTALPRAGKAKGSNHVAVLIGSEAEVRRLANRFRELGLLR